VTAFKAPTEEERAHDFLWRIRNALPVAGEVGIFDRSHYEDVLIARVHKLALPMVIGKRYQLINRFEQNLVAEGAVLVKCFLHISPDEQRNRLLTRLDDPTKHWKYNPSDVDERALWPEYQEAYRLALEKCSTEGAPWYVIPADTSGTATTRSRGCCWRRWSGSIRSIRPVRSTWRSSVSGCSAADSADSAGSAWRLSRECERPDEYENRVNTRTALNGLVCATPPSHVVALHRRDPANKEFMMKKTRLGIIGAVAVALPVIAPAAALADAPGGTTDDLPTLNAAWETWNEGGMHVGGGAAELVSAAVLGVPDLVLSLPEFLAGSGTPKDVTFSGEEASEPSEGMGSSH